MNILLTGAISLSNKGTAAIVLSTISMLKKTYPQSHMSIELFYPEKQRKIIDLEKEYGVNIISPLPQFPLQAAILLFLTIVLRLNKGFNIKSLKIQRLKAYVAADVIIDLSAEGFVRLYNQSLFEAFNRFLIHLYPLLIGLLLRTPIVLFAQSLAPFGAFKPIMKCILQNSALVTVRDSTSIEQLKKDGIDTSKVHLTADPAFLLDFASNDRVTTLLASEGIDLAAHKGQDIIGICIGKILSSEKHERMIKTIAHVADLLIEDRNAIVVFIPHSSGKIRTESNDVLVGLDIKKQVKKKACFYVITGDYAPQDLKGIVGALDCLLSLRMHPVIFAASMKVPSVIIAFNQKAYGLMSMLALNENVIHVDRFQENVLCAHIEKCLIESQSIKSRLENVIPHVVQKSWKNITLLERIFTAT